MANLIILNDQEIQLLNCEKELINGLHQVTVTFNVTSEEYHDITTLLYNGTFDVKIPGEDLMFRGTIINYSTSITNLYEKDQVGQFKLILLEERIDT
ncbi:DUF3219 family protein [Ornithinibacillus halotolerans]|uniref:DUF3219 family protein n=1 Tax=Ornithinibacillus halotolerans TaxID=1274357 RepID=A0A916RXT1_9BACI|nr:DUF3219 family protein [Ornithinibacillus halotolerans]GGA76158.1 hypothetical protein GCM10008025_19750 [Ornithinibacillus halotolerans]